MLRLVLLLGIVISCYGQQDTYRVGTGISYDYYGKTGFAASLDVDARVSSTSHVFYHVSLDMTSLQAVLRPGVEYEMFNSRNWNGSLFGDAGVSNGTGAVLGAFSGGGKLGYNIGNKMSKGKSNYYIEFTCKLLYISGLPSVSLPATAVGVQPIFGIHFTKGF